MRKFLKKPLVYLLATMMFFPTWIVTGLTNIQHAKAYDPASISDHIVISELATNYGASTNEFVELYNPTLDEIDVSNWEIVYQSPSAVEGFDWSVKATFPAGTTIKPFSYYLASSNGYSPIGPDGVAMTADTHSTAASFSFNNDNGYVGVSNGLGEVIDYVGYGSLTDPTLAEGGVAAPSPSTKSIERMIDNNTGNFIDSNDNGADFYYQVAPNPQNSGNKDLFTQMFIDSKVKVNPADLISADGKANFDIEVKYPQELLDKVKPQYVVDAMIETSAPITVGAKLTLSYGATVLGTYTFTDATSQIWLSQIVSGINPALPTRTFLQDEPATSNWSFSIEGLAEGVYEFYMTPAAAGDPADFDAEDGIIYPLSMPGYARLVVDSSVAMPTNVAASKSGKDIKVGWNAVTDDLSGLAGYNIYSNEDNYTAPLNAALLTANSFELVSPADGSYTFKVTAEDNAGNISTISDPSNTVVVDSSKPVAPTITATTLEKTDGKYIHVAWKGVGGYIDKYEIYINGITSADNTLTIDNLIDDLGKEYTKDIKVLNDGTYDVYVKVLKLSDYASSATQSVKFVTPIVVSPVVETPVTPVVSIAPQKAAAATEPQPSAVATTPDDSNGQIKGDDSTTPTEESKINWTPWIVLFVLILLAGAATGGYFYWFNGEEEAKAAVPEVVKEAKTVKAAPVITKATTQKKPQKKSKRW